MPSRKLIGAAAMTAALATGGALGATLGAPTISGAQDGATTTTVPAESTPPAATDDGPGRGGRGFGGGVDLEVAAKPLGITADELRTQLQDGKSLADVAEAEGVDDQVVVDALAAAAKDRVAEAVTDGTLTQAEADARTPDLAERIAEGLDDVRTGGPGGGGRRGPGADRPADAPAEEGTTTTAPAAGDRPGSRTLVPGPAHPRGGPGSVASGALPPARWAAR